MGVFFSALAALSWGIGDFLIQRSARKFGDWEALFFITIIGSIILLPFVWDDVVHLTATEWLILSGTSALILTASLFDFNALRVGKIAVIEPIFAMEIPITIALASFFIGEKLTFLQFTLVALLLLGIFLVTNKRFGQFRKKLIEKGVWFAVIATVGMGASNFMFGIASRATDPLMINWFTSVFMATATLGYLLYKGHAGEIINHWRHSKRLLLGVGLIDNMAWVAYSISTLHMPIAVATALTESYIALAAILGITLNKEKLRLHQYTGLILTVVAACALAFTVEE